MDCEDDSAILPLVTGLPSLKSAGHKMTKNPSDGDGETRQNKLGNAMLYGVPIVSLVMDGIERLCLAQISNTLLKNFSYNEIHNRRVALGITCIQCTPVQLELLRRAGAMPVSSRRCGMITKREAERLCKSFLETNTPPRLPENFAFDVHHECAWGCRGSFVPARYNSSRAKCIKCYYCAVFFSPNKFIFHSHRLPNSKYVQPDAANFNSWRRHLKLSNGATDDVEHAWEDVKAMFNGGTRKKFLSQSHHHQSGHNAAPLSYSPKSPEPNLPNPPVFPFWPPSRAALPFLSSYPLWTPFLLPSPSVDVEKVSSLRSLGENPCFSPPLPLSFPNFSTIDSVYKSPTENQCSDVKHAAEDTNLERSSPTAFLAVKNRTTPPKQGSGE